MKDFLVFRAMLSKLAEKKILLACLKAGLALLSLVVTHYAGFVSGFPIVMVSAAAVDMFPTFSALFLFYLTFCYSFSKIAAFIVSQGVSAFFISRGAFRFRQRRRQRLRAYIKDYKQRPTDESLWYHMFAMLFFMLLLYQSYVKPKVLDLGAYFFLAVFLIAIAALLKSDILALKLESVVKRLKNQRRVKYRSNLISAYISLGFGAVLCVAFQAGDLRRDKLMQEEPISYKSNTLDAQLVVLMSSSSSVVGVEEDDLSYTWIYATKDSVQRFRYEKRSEKAKPTEEKTTDE